MGTFLLVVGVLSLAAAQGCDRTVDRQMNDISIKPGGYLTYQFRQGTNAALRDEPVYLKDVRIKAWALQNSQFNVNIIICT